LRQQSSNRITNFRLKAKKIDKFETEYEKCLLPENIKIGDCTIDKIDGLRKKIYDALQYIIFITP